MSFGRRLSRNEMRLVIGAVYSNDLAPRFEEHRAIERVEGDQLYFRITTGKRAGREGNCKVASFWLWARRPVAEGK